MRLIDADSVLNGIEELKKSPWFNRGKEIVKGDPGFQHIGYIERKEAIEVVRDLCIRKEPTVDGWISVKDRLPEPYMNVLCCVRKGWGWMLRVCWLNGNSWEIFDGYSAGSGWVDCDNERIRNDGWSVTHWMPPPEPPKEK